VSCDCVVVSREERGSRSQSTVFVDSSCHSNSASVLTASLTGENGARQLTLQMQSGDLFLIVADEVHAHVSSS
jgi:hypothetical protein